MADSYKHLCAEIKDEFKKASDESEQNFRYRKLLRNWNIGKKIEEYTDSDNSKGNSRSSIINKLADDFKVNKRYLQEACRFYKIYLKPPKNNGLSWTHYQQLITIEDKAQRDAWERRVIKEGVGSKVFARLLYDNRIEKRGIADVKNGSIEYLRGIPYIYHVIKMEPENSVRSEMVVDCGFYIDCRQYMNKNLVYKPGDIIRSVRSGNGYDIKRARNEYRQNMYTYKADVLSVVDGDTLKCNIDVGFNIRLRCKVRLRGIDAPELSGVRGEASRKYVQEQIKGSKFIIVKSYGMDMYGRYLVDVFYKSNCIDVFEMAGSGLYLNQELVDNGMAEIWK